ncbi:eIF2A-related protein [Reticulibacter mediterranei]|uniref:WD40 domain-containing protein n=1 Tax=Reticulibacter mediterranei TaxID=2778369 RepID=UPI001C68CC01|nr:WD40 repeat domain-containing protein [Reticulibacter mediterranei]
MIERANQRCVQCGASFPVYGTFCPTCGQAVYRPIKPLTLSKSTVLKPVRLRAVSSPGIAEMQPTQTPLQPVLPPAPQSASTSLRTRMMEITTLRLPAMRVPGSQERSVASSISGLLSGPLASQPLLTPEKWTRGSSVLSVLALMIALILCGTAISTFIRGGSLNTGEASRQGPAYKGHTQSVYQACWSPDGKYIASAGGLGDGTVQVWEAATERMVITYHEHATAALALAWSPDGKYIASAGYGDMVRVWEALSGRTVFIYEGHHNASVLAVAWSPDGNRIATGGVDNTVQVWDALTGNHVVTYREFQDDVTALDWSSDGRIAVGSVDGAVQVWEASAAKHLLTYTGHSGAVYALAWSPDNRLIASGGEDKMVQVWDVATKKVFSVYKGHTAKVNALAWSTNEMQIVSGGEDKTVQVWDALTGKHIATYRGHAGSVNAVAWSPDGKKIVSGSADKTVLIW